MAILKAKGQQTTSIQRLSEGADVYLRALRDGSMVQADWKQAAIMGGFGYTVTSGALSTGVVEGTSIDIDSPCAMVSVPNGTSILPLRVSVQVQTAAPADAAEAEILIAVDQDKAWDATGAPTVLSIYNMNTLCGKTSACVSGEIYTSTIQSAPVNDLELARKVVEYDIGSGTASFAHGVILDLVYEPANPSILNGPCMLLIYWGGDSAVIGGFAQVQWLEFPETTFSV